MSDAQPECRPCHDERSFHWVARSLVPRKSVTVISGNFTGGLLIELLHFCLSVRPSQVSVARSLGGSVALSFGRSMPRPLRSPFSSSCCGRTPLLGAEPVHWWPTKRSAASGRHARQSHLLAHTFSCLPPDRPAAGRAHKKMRHTHTHHAHRPSNSGSC